MVSASEAVQTSVGVAQREGHDLENRTKFIGLLNDKFALNGLDVRVESDGSISSGQNFVGVVTGTQCLVYDSLTVPYVAKRIEFVANPVIQGARGEGIIPSSFRDVELYSPPGS